MLPRRTQAALAAAALAAAAWVVVSRSPTAAESPFAAEIERLSEPGGYFDTDNLISNESSYLAVVPALIASGATGGAYIGVGPDQNFSYIARVRPSIAYIVDIRRDNLLLHLLLKALFAEAATRVEYLSLLTGRAPPANTAVWRRQSIRAIVAYVDATPRARDIDTVRERLDARIARFGVALSAGDLDTIHRFHGAFVDEGLDLRFQTHGRAPRPTYPTFRQLLLATDREGRTWNYLAAEEDFHFVRELQAQDRIVPVVGDLGGARAMRAIAARLAEQGTDLSAIYVSNVPAYLSRARMLDRFYRNIALLPRDSHSVMIRSEFGGGSSVSSVRPIHDMLASARP